MIAADKGMLYAQCNSAKIDITMGKNPDSRAVMLRRIEEMTNGEVVYDASKDEFYLKKAIQNKSLTL